MATIRSSISRLADDVAPVPHPNSWPARPAPRLSYRNAIHEVLEQEARATALATIKMRARVYALKPRDLNAICPGLWEMSPSRLVGMLTTISNLKRRYTGFGGEIPAVNLHGARLYSRYLRAKACQKRGGRS